MRYRLFLNWVKRMFKLKRNVRLGIYGPPNTGKTTLANRIISDFVGAASWKVSELPHETRWVQQMNEVVLMSPTGKKLEIDLFDMPGISTREELHTDAFDEFLKSGMSESDACLRLMEATDGISESVKFMRRIDSAIVVLDSTKSPYTKVNALILGVLKANNVKVVIAANKVDLPNADPQTIRAALPKLPVIEISSTEGTNMDKLYEAVSEHLRS